MRDQLDQLGVIDEVVFDGGVDRHHDVVPHVGAAHDGAGSLWKTGPFSTQSSIAKVLLHNFMFLDFPQTAQSCIV